MSPKKVFIFDPHPVILDGLQRVFESQSDLIITGTAMNVEAAVSSLKESLPDILVLDPCYIHFEPLALLQALRIVAPAAPILLYMTNDDTILAERSLNQGVKGYVLKSEPVDLLLGVVRWVACGGVYYSAKLIERLKKQRFSRCYFKGELQGRRLEVLSVREQQVFERPTFSVRRYEVVLSVREQQVFERVGQGMSSYKIAETLLLSPKTVEVHKANIRHKLHLDSSRLLIMEAMKWVKSLKKRS